MKRFFNFYTTHDKILFWGFATSLTCAIFIINLFAFLYPKLPSTIPLFYSLPWGSAQLASLSQFIILPSVVLLIFFFNLILAWHLHHSQILLKRSLALSSALCAIILAIAAYKITTIFT